MATLQAYKQPYKKKGNNGKGIAVVNIKEGDQEVGKGKVGYRNGEIVDVIFYDDWRPNISDSHASAFVTLVCSSADAVKIREAIEWNASCKDPSHENFGSNERFAVDLSSKDFDDIRSSLYVKNAVKSFVDITPKAFSSVAKKRDLGDITLLATKDVNAWSGGTARIGDDETYLTLAAWSADLANLTEDGVATVKTATTETGNVSVNIDIGTYDLTLTSDAHNGDSTSGNLITVQYTFSWLNLTENSSGGNVYILNLNLKQDVDRSSGGKEFIYGVSNTGSHTVTIRNCIVNNNNKLGRGIVCNDADVCYVLENVIVMGCSSTGIALVNGCGFTLYHVTVYNCYDNIDCVTNSVTLTNCASYDAHTRDDYLRTGSATLTKCASSDATGSAGLQNRVSADDFVSTTPADGDDYALPVRGGGLADGATTTVTESINGVAIPNAGGTRYIGAKAQTTLVDLSGATIDPASGPAAGGTTVDISGATGLGASGGSCTFGGNASTVDSHDNTDATVETPSGSGTVDFSWENSDGESDTLADAFEYESAAGGNGKKFFFFFN